MPEPLSLICPNCSSKLPWPGRSQSVVICPCGKSYQSLLGIVDLRTGEDPYCGNSDDNRIAADLACQFHESSFQPMLAYYFHSHCPELDARAISRQSSHILDKKAEIQMNQASLGRAADLGTGTAGAILELANAGFIPVEIIGVDVAMRWLVLARKRLDEAALPQVRLVCANAEALPLEKSQFTIIYGGDMIEHVADPAAVLSETARLLTPGGLAFFPTPNRFSLGREPHVGLFFAGWLPRWLTPAYCQWRGAPPWQGIFTKSCRGWKMLSKILFFNNPAITYSVSAGEIRRSVGGPMRLIHAYNAALRISGLFRFVARCFGPILLLSIKRRSN
ncbi:MAG: class I SAM-dependent methyltransferase [bacterium]